MATQHRDEALKVLSQVIARLADPQLLVGLEKMQLRATVEYARDEVEAIQEVKRARKAAN